MAQADDVRRLCLAQPEVLEQDYHGVPTFRVAGRKFASLHPVGASHFADIDFQEPAVVVHLDREDQRGLAEAYPEAILPHRYFARHGWAVVVLRLVDEALLGLLLRMAWACVAPKRLLRRGRLQRRKAEDRVARFAAALSRRRGNRLG